MRKLVTIRKINNIEPIAGADAIVVATVDGWKLVVKKDEFNIGDLCVYCEIDSFLPERPEFEFLRPRCFKRMGEKSGFRLRTIRLRGQISQGLLLPISVLGERHEIFTINDNCIGTDVSDQLGVEKYEAPIPAALVGQVEGNFPEFIKKTDQERCQNLGNDIFSMYADTQYEVTLKLDGTSFTGFYNNGEDGVCSRNLQLKVNDENANNTFVKMFVNSNMQAALHAYGRNLAIQGELMGPAIQSNREQLLSHTLYVFDIFDINTRCHLQPDDRKIALQSLYDLGLKKDMVHHVPMFAYNVTLADMNIFTVDDLLKDASGPSITHAIREGKVYKSMDGQFSFKSISNDFLLKEKD
jgi:RNA ligase (TIGR02306 family)